MYDLIIIGGGPAGITAGIYAARKKLNTLLITKDFFGQISKTGEVENWPGEFSISGMALASKLEKHLKNFSLEIKNNEKVVLVKSGNEKSFLVQTESGVEFESKAIIVATGRNARNLGVEGEEKLTGKGVSYCSICDGPFFKNKQVVVVGGGNAGFEAALDLAKYSSQVFLLEKGNRFLADELLQEKAKQTGKIETILKAEILKIEGENKVEAVVWRDLESGQEIKQVAGGVFVQIGSAPATSFLQGLVEFNQNNEIKVNPNTLQSSMNGLFAAGDCNDTKHKQLVIAAGQGAIAALSAYDYLQNNF